MQDQRRPLWPIGVMAAILICGARNSASCPPSTRLTPSPPSIPPRPTTYICRTCKRITTVLHFFPRKAYDFRGNFVSLQRDTQKNKNMERTQVIDNIRQVAARVLPKGSTLYLYGSRARGDAHEDSDWDLLLLLNNKGDSDENFRRYAYPIIARGYDLWQSFSVHTYSKDEWYNGPHAMFYYNVEHDKQLIYES